MTNFDQQAIERLLGDFAWHADRGEGVALAALFLPDAVLTVGGNDLRGRDAIAADCHRRFENPGRKTRHIWSNLRLERIEGGTIMTTAIQMTFEQYDPEKPAHLRLNDLFDSFRKDESGAWRFASRLIKREMALSIPA